MSILGALVGIVLVRRARRRDRTSATARRIPWLFMLAIGTLSGLLSCNSTEPAGTNVSEIQPDLSASSAPIARAGGRGAARVQVSPAVAERPVGVTAPAVTAPDNSMTPEEAIRASMTIAQQAIEKDQQSRAAHAAEQGTP